MNIIPKEEWSKYTDYEEIDMPALAQDRIIWQYEKSPVLRALIGNIVNVISELQYIYIDLLTARHLETAAGESLDIIGRIVGQNRVIPNYQELELVFGFGIKAGIGPWGTPWGSRLDSPNVTLDDDLYREFIIGKIYKNFSRATCEDVANLIIQTLPSITIVKIVDGSESASFEIQVNSDAEEKDLNFIRNQYDYDFLQGVTSIGKPVGVKFLGVNPVL